MKAVPKISVVMSLYNSSKHLREAIDSILNQTLLDFEFIIIDDGSSDNGVDIVRSYDDSRIRLVTQKNAGLAAALNSAVKIANSKLIARMDPDDISLPYRLSKQYDYLQQNPEVMVLGSAAICIDEDGKELPMISMKKHFNVGNQPMPESPCIHPSVIFRRSAFERAGGYRAEMRFGGEDAVLFNQILSFGAVDNLSDVLLYYRLSPSSLSQKSKKFNELLRRVICKKVLNNSISSKDWDELSQEYQHTTGGESSYHLYVAKLFLRVKEKDGNAKARCHLLKAIKNRPCLFSAWGYLASSYIPLTCRVLIYSCYKKCRVCKS